MFLLNVGFNLGRVSLGLCPLYRIICPPLHMCFDHQLTIPSAYRIPQNKFPKLPASHIIWIDQGLAKRSWDVFGQYNIDKQWSFTDCTSYVVMKDFAITEVFAFDHHFEQMGFIRLPSLPR